MSDNMAVHIPIKGKPSITCNSGDGLMADKESVSRFTFSQHKHLLQISNISSYISTRKLTMFKTMNKYKQCVVIFFLMSISSLSYSATLPINITRQLPSGHTVLTFKSGDLTNDKKTDYIVVVHKEAEKQIAQRNEYAPRRPLLAFIQNNNGTFTLVARNDHVVFAVNEGGQCDPFLDGEDGLALKGSFFTVQNSVACGDHWTDYITFKYSHELNSFVFYKRIFENWIMNPSDDPDADMFISGNRSVTYGKKKQILLQNYQAD
jgi:hypothetical protein